VKAEKGYWAAFVGEIYTVAVPLYLEALAVQDDYNAEKDPDEKQRLRQQYLELYRRFVAMQEQFINRIDLWVNKGLMRIFGLGKLAANANQMLVWRLGPTDHCATCAGAAGQRHRAKDWKRSGILPQSGVLECGGYQCQCSLEPTNERAHGRLDRIPTKHVHLHDHEHDHEEPGEDVSVAIKSEGESHDSNASD